MKSKVAILFGGCSSEYDVSLMSATSVIKNINQDKYDLILIGISKDGNFYLYNGDVDKIETNEWLSNDTTQKVTISINRNKPGFLVLDTNEIIKVDIVFPVLHGRNGEDGRLQGMLELAGIKYVGCDMISSAICMDKHLAHKIVEEHNILCPQSYLFDAKDDIDSIKVTIENSDVQFPLFVKPLKAGSSFGITKIKNINELSLAITDALKYDNKIVIEEGIDGFEVGCAVLGNDSLTVGEIDEIEIQTDLFDYFEKYNLKTSKIHLPARIEDENEKKRIKDTAKEIYQILGCSGFARVDMFYTPKKQIVFNEVNTIPGCTSHSRYPSMLKEIGMPFEEVIDNLIQLGFQKEFAK